jgi:uncharacterized protein YdeI (YjbR/CyaY-like superfamily)
VGIRRGYSSVAVIHIPGAKQSETRPRRVDRCVPDILAGRGFNER